MVSTNAEQVSYHSGCGRAITGAKKKRQYDTAVLQGSQGGLIARLQCTGCGEDIMEQDVFDITGYRVNEQGHDEVTFICPLCGAESTSMRAGRISHPCSRSGSPADAPGPGERAG